MTPQDIEAELSYAYLHAVASRAGIACQGATRTHDNLGIDAILTLAGDLGEDALLCDVTLHIQLKATTKPPTRKHVGQLGYFIDVAQYDRLRARSMLTPKLLAVLFLPELDGAWLTHSVEGLTLRRCAYWMSLAGAPPTANDSGTTVYFPEQQELSHDGLLSLFRRVARREDLYHAP